MWEYNIVCNPKDRVHLRNIENNLKSKYPYIITALSDNVLSVALNYNQKPKVFEYIKRLLAETIIYIYKEKLLLNS
ncbi:MAG TPA: hypothetical protein DD621_02910, partial [Clostridiales bacterium]|nr:hypothetical protein [Clostridiales bacterium]